MCKFNVLQSVTEEWQRHKLMRWQRHERSVVNTVTSTGVLISP